MTYEYVCTDCGHEWEAEQRISESALTDCPSCAQSSAKRQISGGMGFVLKGSGWYSDLYGLKPKGATDGGSASGNGVSDEASPPAKKPADESSNSADTKGSGDTKAQSSTKTSDSTKSDAKPGKASAA